MFSKGGFQSVQIDAKVDVFMSKSWTKAFKTDPFIKVFHCKNIDNTVNDYFE